jgi:hypothetical protein
MPYQEITQKHDYRAERITYSEFGRQNREGKI